MSQSHVLYLKVCAKVVALRSGVGQQIHSTYLSSSAASPVRNELQPREGKARGLEGLCTQKCSRNGGKEIEGVSIRGGGLAHLLDKAQNDAVIGPAIELV